MIVRALHLFSFAAVALLGAGCVGPGTTQSPRLFVLTTTASPAPTNAGPSDLRLGVGPVEIPERLNRPQILTLAGPHEVKLSEFSQWAEPLEGSIPRVLAENLSRLVPTDRVSVYPWPSRESIELQVTVDIIRFEGQIGGNVSLAARWRLLQPSGPELQPLRLSRYTEPTDGDTTEALVAALSRILGALSADIAAEIAHFAP